MLTYQVCDLMSKYDSVIRTQHFYTSYITQAYRNANLKFSGLQYYKKNEESWNDHTNFDDVCLTFCTPIGLVNNNKYILS